MIAHSHDEKLKSARDIASGQPRGTMVVASLWLAFYLFAATNQLLFNEAGQTSRSLPIQERGTSARLATSTCGRISKPRWRPPPTEAWQLAVRANEHYANCLPTGDMGIAS